MGTKLVKVFKYQFSGWKARNIRTLALKRFGFGIARKHTQVHELRDTVIWVRVIYARESQSDLLFELYGIEEGEDDEGFTVAFFRQRKLHRRGGVIPSYTSYL